MGEVEESAQSGAQSGIPSVVLPPPPPPLPSPPFPRGASARPSPRAAQSPRTPLTLLAPCPEQIRSIEFRSSRAADLRAPDALRPWGFAMFLQPTITHSDSVPHRRALSALERGRGASVRPACTALNDGRLWTYEQDAAFVARINECSREFSLQACAPTPARGGRGGRVDARARGVLAEGRRTGWREWRRRGEGVGILSSRKELCNAPDRCSFDEFQPDTLGSGRVELCVGGAQQHNGQ